jgi:hypothetical protein
LTPIGIWKGQPLEIQLPRAALMSLIGLHFHSMVASMAAMAGKPIVYAAKPRFLSNPSIFGGRPRNAT